MSPRMGTGRAYCLVKNLPACRNTSQRSGEGDLRKIGGTRRALDAQVKGGFTADLEYTALNERN